MAKDDNTQPVDDQGTAPALPAVSTTNTTPAQADATNAGPATDLSAGQHDVAPAEEQAQAEQPAQSDQGLVTPETPIHNVDKAVIAPQGIHGDPDPANPTLSNPSLLSQAPVYSEQQLAEAAAAQNEEPETAPAVKVGDMVTFVNVHSVERLAFVTSTPENGDVTLHAFNDFDDVDYRESGAIGLYHGVPFSSKNKPYSWHTLA